MAPYRYEITCLHALVQQVATALMPKGYFYYTTGFVPHSKPVELVDAKLIDKYGIARSRSSRARRKAAGLANLQYLRIRGDRHFLILATDGEHRFKDEEKVRDFRRDALIIGDYSLSYKRGGFLQKADPDAAPVPDPGWHSRVQIARDRYADLQAEFLDIALRFSARTLGEKITALGFEPYAPIRQQVLNLIRLINDRRSAAGLDVVSPSYCRCERQIFKPFVVDNASPATAGANVITLPVPSRNGSPAEHGREEASPSRRRGHHGPSPHEKELESVGTRSRV